MSKTRKVIGEGSFGCVHDPSLHCTHLPKPNFDYKDYVSKLMKTKRAEEELAEFVNFHKYDPKDEYHLGTPIMCKPNLREPGVSADISKCKRLSAEVASNPDQYDLLVMKYGGPDLKIFCKDKINQYLKTNKEEKSDKFWLEAHHLIKGLQFFRDSGIVHNDLKPQNILFNTKTNKLMFIDFGLMQTKSEIIRTSKNNTNNQAVFHWSYPLDCGLMSYNEYSRYRRGAANGRRKLVKDELIGMLVSDAKKNTAKLDIKKPEAFEIFFSYINPNGKDLSTAAKYAFIEDFFDGLDEMVKLSYDDYLDDIIDSIDVYGLGFTLQYILNCFKRHKAVSEDFFNKSSALFSKMYDSNPDNRELNINKLLDEYEDILLETGLLSRLNKSFEDNELVDSAPMPSPIMRLAHKEEKEQESSSAPLSTRLEKIAYMDPINTKATKVCPPDKELNVKTGRCIKKCGLDQTRNAQGRCTKTKTKTLKAVAMNKKQTRRKSQSQSQSQSQSRTIKKSPTSEELMNNFFPELKQITPFKKPTVSSDSASYNRLLEVTQKKMAREKEKEKAKTITNVNNKFPYEIKSKE
jgi:serine/threonine protein kinase